MKDEDGAACLTESVITVSTRQGTGTQPSKQRHNEHGMRAEGDEFGMSNKRVRNEIRLSTYIDGRHEKSRLE